MWDKVLEQCRYLKSKNSVLAYQHIFWKGVVGERELYSLLSVDISRMKLIAKELVSKHLISVRIDETGNTYYLCNKSNYQFKKCEKCRRFIKKLINKDLELEAKLCKKTSCKYHYILERHNDIDAVSKVTTGVLINTVTKNDTEEKSMADWGCKEFAKYIKKRYRDLFPGVKFPYPTLSIINRINELCIMMKRMVGSKEYVLYCKQHIDYIFRKLKNSDEFNVALFLDIKTIDKTIKVRSRQENHKNIAKATYCNKYRIQCTYCENGECGLEQDDIECTKDIREHMERKYGI